ncbi:M24 family metallopeptidase [Roseovarius sp. ZX-A-9]|uniref:M24 family metallopeptidase n=1 Tax=Roseovarius sp. ZX-A-9 TaxID=3014783 RepID=UPI00232BC066|nr:Xaa-Pro peptidase family protein [Roseovarius sp. ZX-A-9]
MTLGQTPDIDWSQFLLDGERVDIDHSALQSYRLDRLRAELRAEGAAVGVFVSPVSLRYAVDHRAYGLFQSHIPVAYLFVPVQGPVVMHGGLSNDSSLIDEVRPARAISYFNGGSNLIANAQFLAEDLNRYLAEIGTTNRRVAIEYVNPSLTQALMAHDFDVIDAVGLIENARAIKCKEEIDCIRYAIRVANLGIDQMRKAIRPGVTELQLWAMLNFANLANNGDWHDGRMLASGERINPWYQEASERKLEAGDLVGFDTDMVGPNGYCADISRTMFCGPGKPSKRQKELYAHALSEIEHNLAILRPGMTFDEFSDQAYVQPEEFHANRYTCIAHGVGMCDEYPKIYYPMDRKGRGYPGTIEENMVLCIESYVGAVGERDGVKLEQQVLITADGYELLSDYPLDEALMS